MLIVGMRSHRLKAHHAFGLEELNGCELIVSGEACIQADHVIELLVGHGAGQLQDSLEVLGLGPLRRRARL
jgi:hypothetical protein